jgi:hypothetical protein
MGRRDDEAAWDKLLSSVVHENDAAFGEISRHEHHVPQLRPRKEASAWRRSQKISFMQSFVMMLAAQSLERMGGAPFQPEICVLQTA